MKKSIVALMLAIVMAGSIFALTGCASMPSGYINNLVKEVVRDGDTYNVQLKEKQFVDTVILEENADKVTEFEIYGKDDEEWKMIYRSDRIDKYRMCVLDGMETDALKIKILSKNGDTKINSIKAFAGNVEVRTKDFRVSEYMRMDGTVLQDKINTPEYLGYFNIIDDLILFDAVDIDNNVNVSFQEGVEDWERDIATVREIQAQHNPDMKIVCSVGIKAKTGLDGTKNDNKGVKNFINDNIDTLVTRIAEFATKYDIDGIDFDWEYPENLSQWNAYNLLIERLYDEFAKEGKGRYITLALAPWRCDLSRSACQKVEYVNLMTYDLFDDRGEHASFYETTKKAVEKFLDISKFSEEQILLGLSTYGRTTNRSAAAWPTMSEEKTYEALGKWGNYVRDYKYTENDQMMSCDGYINGYAMNRDKTAYALSTNLGGVMIFRMMCDAPYTKEYSIHKAIEQTIDARYYAQ